MPFIFMGLLHLTVLGVVAFFILFAAGRAEGFVALLGRVLGYWVLLLAVLGAAFHIWAGATGHHPMMMGGPWMHHHHWDDRGPPPGAPQTEQGTPAAPDQAKPAPKQPS